MTENTPPQCGLCGATACEVDGLVQLGQMGHLCLCCLEQLAIEKLPGSVTAPPGLSVVRRADMQDAVHDTGQSDVEKGNVIPLRSRTANPER
jgi:hypothetical protein